MMSMHPSIIATLPEIKLMNVHVDGVFLHPHTPVFMVDDWDGLTGLALRAILEISEWWYFHQISDVLEISVWYFLGNILANA